MIFPTSKYEHYLQSQGYNYIAGVDEAGRGAWAGPLVAAAVIMPYDNIIAGVHDSKLLNQKKREEIFLEIKKTAICWSVGIVDIEYINQYNIGRANVKAFEMAVDGLDVKPDYVMIDGVRWRQRVSDGQRFAHGKIPPNPPLGRGGIAREYIKDGDAKSYSIAAASIIAKVTRDNILKEMHIKYPAYGFDKHKGYGTKGHSDALLKYGICAEHRILYKPIKRIMKRES